MSRLRPLVTSDDLGLLTTRRLVGPVEPAALLFQAILLMQSAILDPYPVGAEAVLVGLSAGHFGGAFAAGWARGPVRRGGIWLLGWLALVVVVPVVVAFSLPVEVYGNNQGCVQLCGYPNPPILLVAFYPWTGMARPRRLLAEVLLVAVVLAEPALLIWARNGHWLQVNTRSIFSTGLLAVASYGLGKTVGRMCLVAARSQTDVQQQSYDEFFNFLHSHVKAGIAAVRAESGNPDAMREKLDELEQAVSERRIELLLARYQVPLAALLSERTRAFAGALEMATPRVGALTVPRPTGVMISRIVGDLLKNTVNAGATKAAIHLQPNRDRITVQICDNGPGLDPAVLDDETKSLHRLRRDIERHGGSLELIQPGQLGGAHLHITLDMHPTRGTR